MKKISCKCCSETWYVEDQDLDKQNVCPFCSVGIREKVEFAEFDSLDKAIYDAITNMGNEILFNPRKLSGYLMDVAPRLKKEIRIFSKTINEEYVAFIKEAFAQDEEGALATLNKLRYIFVDEEGLSESWADMICDGLLGAIMYTKGKGISSIITAEVTDSNYVPLEEELSENKEETLSEYNMQFSNELRTTSEKLKNEEIVLDNSIITKTQKCECKICGYIIDANDLELNGGKCPICKLDKWKIVDNEKANDNGIQGEIRPDITLPNNDKWAISSKKYSKDSPEEICETAKKYYLGKGEKKDETFAIKLFRKAATFYNYIPAYNYLGEIFCKKRDFTNTYKWYMKSAEANDPEGNCMIGYLYEQRGDHSTALKYYVKAVNAGNYKLLIDKALKIQAGKDMPRNETVAADILSEIAKVNDSEAIYQLGLCYKNGIGRTVDRDKANKLFKKAAAQGHTMAQSELQALSFTDKLKLHMLS